MNVLLVGGPGSFINNLIIKLNKEGHRIYLLTGTNYKQASYQKVFERYDFTYDSPCLNEIFESVNPDLVLYLGAFDTNFVWNDEEKTSVRYTASLMNILMAYARNPIGRFVYLSSDEVYYGDYENNIRENEELTPNSFRGMALAQGEELCQSYREYQKKDIITLRLGRLYSIPKERSEINNICARMCLEALQRNEITVVKDNAFSLLYETDAVEYIYRILSSRAHQYPVYNLSSSVVSSEQEIAEMICEAMGEPISIIQSQEKGGRIVLANHLMDSEFGNPFCCDEKAIIQQMASYMKKRKNIFLNGESAKEPFWKRVIEKSGWFIKAIIPFLENLICFVIFFLINANMTEENVFSKLDFFLIYVLLFAIVYGQQQATFSAMMSLVGYCIIQMSERGSFEVMLDSNTYIWLAQLFILGLVVGYMRDQLTSIKKENEEEKGFYFEQLSDIQDINSSNIRVKDALEIQLINQKDSVGKIYSITSALDKYSPEEVLFYAAEMLAELMKCKDVAIYTVSNEDYARLFSYTSLKAKSLGNSIKYPEMGEVYQTLVEGKVYINRKMDERYPLMANAIWEDDKIKMMIFVWGLSWENMTLGQANQLTVISYLIQNAVLRANRYIAALEERRYVEGSRMLESSAFMILAGAYAHAENRGLTECAFLKIKAKPEEYVWVGSLLASKLRLSDFVGTSSDGNLYALLANSSEEDAEHVMRRFAELGYESEIVEDEGIWIDR